MSYTAIKVENIGKQYAIGESVTEYDTLRDRIMEVVTKPFSKDKKQKVRETFLALDDVNFSVEQGEVVGIIGRNGAGKSTLLKILSRITTPTSGRIRIRGRIGTLLEVGTGFHPELTGRENIFMNGAILGMSRGEIRAKFDEIVDFSGVERFIDTPVKRYSSGMYVRLAFAVAANLETDILLVDEVLAVGDFAFQQKCLGKMSDVAGAGRTVLFVSHNVGAVQDLCPRTILLENGSVVIDDETNITLGRYIESLATPQSNETIENIPRKNEWLGNEARIIDAHIYNSRNEPTQTLTRGEPFSIEITCRTQAAIEECSFLVGFSSIYDERLMTVTGFESGHVFSAKENQIITGRLHIEHVGFTSGRYYLNVGLTHHSGKNLDNINNIIAFDILNVQYDIDQKHHRNNGFMQINNPEWQVEVVE